MPTKKAKPTLKELNSFLTKFYANTIKQIMAECGFTTRQTFMNKINNPKSISQAERVVFAKHFNKAVDEIDWQDKKNLIA